MQELWKIPTIDKETIISMLMKINTENKVKEFLEYLRTVDLTKMKYTPIMKKLREVKD